MPAGAQISAGDPRAQALRAAMVAVASKDWDVARALAVDAGPAGRAVVDWHWLRDGAGNFDAAVNFLEGHSDWPGLPWLRSRSEHLLPLAGRADDVLFFFGAAAPATGNGALALVNAYRELGRNGDAQATAVLAWLNLVMTAEVETALLDLYPALLASQSWARLDMLLWRGETQTAARNLDRVTDEALRALATARLNIRTGDMAPDKATAQVPETLRGDPGLAFEVFRWNIDQGQRDDAVDILVARSAAPDLIGDPGIWASQRRRLARALMREGDHATAYAIAAPHYLRAGSDYADLEWLAGYLALRFLGAPDKALEHFRHFSEAALTPISLGRAGYWIGRAHEALGHDDKAAEAYALASRYQTSFYGLLASERIGAPFDPALAGAEVFPRYSVSGFRRSSVLDAALLQQAAGERYNAGRFMVHLGETLSRDEIGTLGALAMAMDEPNIAVRLGKEAARQGHTITGPYFPLVDLGVDPLPVDPELALAIARRESEFDPAVQSGAGARGLMQLMPRTARAVAGDLQIDYSLDRLTSDPAYNATLGTAYLAELVGIYGSSPVLVAAAYNAGPSRVDRWMAQFGDPRDAGVDVIDWVEHVPFTETRNYVMRVAESLPVYRQRMGQPPGPIAITAELKGL